MKKGFTLVELLAVIVVLAIIALIAVPTVTGIIKQSEKGAFKDSASGLLESAELYYTNYAGQELELDLSDKQTIEKLNFKGKAPTGGILYINAEGSMSLKMYNDDFCAFKYLEDREVSIKEGNCNDITIK